MSSEWSFIMQSLKDKHCAIAELIEGKTVAYVDIPMHFNIGDMLIYLGTEAFIKEYNINVIYRSGISYRLSKLKKADVILLHGGGNFGDLYPKHQKFREYLIKKFPMKRIICLPQTLYFSSSKAQEKSANVFYGHDDFHLFVRDERSIKVGSTFTKNISLMPDMAHGLHPLIDVRESDLNRKTTRIINMQRVDSEQKKKQNVRVEKKKFDWEDLISPNMRLISKAVIGLNMLGLDKNVYLWRKLVDYMVFKAINYFMGHDTVYSDRLHGVILSSMLAKKIKLYDNSYGKNSDYLKTWLQKYPGIIHDDN